MKVLVFGANGFFGSYATRALAEKHEVVTASRNPVGVQYTVNLNSLEDIRGVIEAERPEVIVNCAGIVENSEKAQLNVTFTSNIFEAAKQADLLPKRFIVSGSASEYGEVAPNDLPVTETTPLKPTSVYGRYKTEEVVVALRYGEELGVQVVIARIFNPLGASMHERMLLPNLIRQARAIKTGSTDKFELSRLDARRDYIDIRDVAEAICVLVDSPLKHSVYNIGSGIATTNGQLIQTLIRLFELPENTQVHETSDSSEPLVACQADITRIREDTGWTPRRTLIEMLQGAIT